MKRTLRLILALFSLLVACTAAGSVIYRVYQARASGERLAGSEYSVLRNALVEVSSPAELADPLLRERLKALFKGSPRLLAAQVRDSGGYVAWKIPADSRYFAMPKDLQEQGGGFIASEMSTVVMSTPLGGGMRLAALYATLTRADIFGAIVPAAAVLGIWSLLALAATLLIARFGAPETGYAAPGTAYGADGESGSADGGGAAEEPAEAGDEAGGMYFTPDDAAGLPAAAAFAAEPGTPPAGKEPVPERGFPDAAPATAGESMPVDEGFGEEPGAPEAEGYLGELPLDEVSPQQPYPEEEPVADGDFVEKDFREEDLEDEDFIREEYSGEDFAEEGVLEEEDRAVFDDGEEFPEEAEELAGGGEELPDRPLETGPAVRGTVFPVPPDAAAARARDTVAPGLAGPSAPVAPRHETAMPHPAAPWASPAAFESRISEEIAKGPDFSVILVRCDLEGPADPAGPALSASVRDYFGIRDLVFESRRGEFGLVLPGLDLGRAMRMSEDLSDVLGSTLGLYRDLPVDLPVHIGITSKSGRDVDAECLVREASSALAKSMSGGASRILAFRPDPKKYGAYLERRRASEEAAGN